MGLIRRAALVLIACCAGCRSAPPTFPENAALHQRANYVGGGGGVTYIGRLRTNEGRIALFEELDGALQLLREMMAAFSRLEGLLPPDAPASHIGAVHAEQRRLRDEAEQVARVARELMDLAVAGKLMEVIPELEEALRLATGRPPAPGLSAATLRERLRLIGGGDARCGAETDDPIARPGGPPTFWVMARDSVDERGREVEYTAEVKARFARILNASRAQRQAMGQYGPFTAIEALPSGERWRFQVGSTDRGAATYRPRTVLIECDYDRRGRLVAGRETVVDASGKEIKLH
jgi:hypothetical protein